MRSRFTKMHGLGNDFVMIRAAGAPPSAARGPQLSDRRSGIGVDQLLWLEPARGGGDIYYRVFNSDGSEAEQCGNGARCIAALLADGQPRQLVLEHASGRSRASVAASGAVTVEMNVPVFTPASIPFVADREQPSYTIAANGENVELRVVSMGNPHAVLRVDDVDRAPVMKLGSLLESHARFPNRANIGFMQVLAPERIRLRVFERGTGETHACGTGACAATVVGRRAGWLGPEVQVSLPGGELTVRWDGPGTPAWLTGEAVAVFEGSVEL
jgi:diaminopimelate epimerase